MSSENPSPTTDPVDLFVRLALELELLDAEQAARLKSRYKQYQLHGIAMRPEAVAKDLGLLTQPQVNRVSLRSTLAAAGTWQRAEKS